MRALLVRHAHRDAHNRLTEEGRETVSRVLMPLVQMIQFDCLASASASHCIETAEVAAQWLRVVHTVPEFDKFVSFHDDLKERARAAGRDHGELWFTETPQDQALQMIRGPGRAYSTGLYSLRCAPAPRCALVILRGTGLEGLACLLDPNYSPFNGGHFDRCEGFWVELVNGDLRLLSYVRRR
ncbi:MAG: hypothetical protein COU33_02955 [Candidatus Magasanikbacteria bacterium CG10_big_fil_rev_8_21_14_0_10_43_6]|uniref:Histidine phosphatase family protein n=1 Tax=Candidatus Magasanikbacteria bacterium CG10_big_fil_rev_8_21_14_0_10_43_6 TaxID=1974650 RepID=A0A2M6W115_9BACT|nr:MAG: hypothetical protein COU33_02955 [Candidatus Magasanikbacteria bacterium CG10_big_fil_rev_8_21_14_0_10_43_6]